MEKLRDYIIIFIVMLFVGIWYYGLTASAASLFDVTDENSPWYPADEIEESIDTVFPDYATNEDGELLINNETSLNDVLNPEPDESESPESVSGGDAEPPITYEDIETIISESLADSRATNISIADAYLSSAIVDVFSRVVSGLPLDYKYAAYRVSSSDNNEGYLVYGAKAKVNGNYLEFSSGSKLAHYYRVQRSNGYTTWYEYKYDVTDVSDMYRVPCGTGQLVYTNMVRGYPALSEVTESNFFSIAVPVLLIAACFILVTRRKNG